MTQTRYGKDELKRRRVIVARLWEAGHGLAAIARAIGVSQQIVRNDMDILFPGRVKTGERRAQLPDPPHEEWRDALPGVPPVPAPPASRPDGITSILQGTAAQLRKRQYRNAFANTALRGDARWRRTAGEAVEGMEEICFHLRRILEDPDYARQMTTSDDGRDDLRSDAGRR
jgi:hypothetical protein